MLVGTFHDTIDHYRTSRPRVGQTLKSPAKEPALLLMAVGLAAYGICLASFADRQVQAGVAAALISLVAMTAGGAWLWNEARRLRKLEDDYNAKMAVESVTEGASAAAIVGPNQRGLANH
ncbi:hypothetical protein HMPREF0591_5576 [Mycobacterium parascrofulaceum ATCC BAA-614]|jgi:uncharacterized membrane protein YcjF (UPF0283 family)|uniref:UsfY protein n=1 Tax=Mycobacterium parascrofulaceum ATCC BAA-614 TaxID=525368 RepID=D5PHD2_9MYCO|nr:MULTISPECIES: hypothetical protein [Mycobacterium]EFG74508.1 hypothetical protein HMPREF0591_5576 [Mycobacterium parascrofulaceum ATCC BAA-614]